MMVETGLPVIERPLDNTALTAYMSCPREYLFAMVYHRRSGGSSAALTFGSGFHNALEALYKGASYAEAMDHALSKWGEKPAPDEYRTPQRLMLVVKAFLKEYPIEVEKRQTLGWPDAPFIEQSVNAMTPAIIHPYAGKLDRAYDDGMVLMEDHKTTSRLDKNTFLQYEGSNQMKGYVFLGQALIPGRKILGIRINLAHVLKTKTGFHRQIFTYTKGQLREWANNYNKWARKIALDMLALHFTELQQDPDWTLPNGYTSIGTLTKDCGFTLDDVERHIEWGPWAAHFGDNGCSRKYGLCQFFHVCKLNPANHMRVLEHEYEVNEWNPLEVENADD